jgi:hypothetical protein
MTSWIAISSTEHADERWLPRKDFANVANMQVVEVFASEISVVTHHFPIGFVKRDDDYQLVALVGLEKDRNLYVDVKGRWISEYIPASLRCYPFISADHKEKADEKVICIDQDCLTDNSDAPRLFNDDGEQEESLTEVVNFLIRCTQDRAATHAACKALAQAGVIEAWPLNVQKGEDEGITSIEGLCRINEAKLNSLDAAEFSGLRETGAFTLAYAQLFSMPQLRQLDRRHRFLVLQQHQLDNHQDVSDSFEADEKLSLD